MTTRFGWLFILAAASGALVAETPAGVPRKLEANTARPQVPVLGYVKTASPLTLRPVTGVPGAVVLGDLIPLPDRATNLVVAEGQQYAIVERSGEPSIAILRLEAGTAADLQAVPGALPHWDLVAFSTGGSFAVLYSGADRRMQVLGGLPSEPQVVRNVDLGTSSDAPVSALAVSDDGSSVAAGTSDGSSGSVWLLPASDPVRKLLSASVPSALRFLARSQDILIGDRGSKQVTLLSGAARLIAGEAQGVNAPIDMGISTDGQRVWIADAGANSLLTVQLDSGAITTEACPYTPASLQRLEGKPVFLIAAQDGDGAGLWAPETANVHVWRLPVGNRVQ